MRFLQPVCLSITLMLCSILMGMGCAGVSQERASAPSSASFSVYALSRGKGVPKETRKVFEKIQEMLEEAKAKGEVRSMKRTRFGLEGESKLCAVFESAELTQRMYDELEQLTVEIDLLNITNEPCK